VPGESTSLHVPGHVPAGRLGHERQRPNPPAVGSQCPDEADLHRFGTRSRGAGERLAMDLIDALDVVGALATEHVR
jgi:hypothetical protein